MRTQFFFVGLLSAVAGTLVGTAGCDNITAGQPTETKAPPQLAHVLIQDARYYGDWPGRASALDILDNYHPPTCTPGVDTCLNEFLIAGYAPDVSCSSAGLCGDPFKIPATGVPVPLGLATIGAAPDMRDPGGGIQVRIVFDKVLDEKIETVGPSGSMTPGATNMYTLVAGLIELDDEAGMAVDSVMYYDPAGSPIYSSDLEYIPLGPALVIKPKASLDAATTYTVKILKPELLVDRSGQAAQGVDGGALPTSFKFTTEQLTPGSGGLFPDSPALNGFDYPNFVDATADMPATILPNETVQISFFENIAGDTATAVVKSGPAGTKLLAYSDRGADATACSKAAAGDSSGIVLDIVNTDTGDIATAAPADWPAGDYTITVTVKDINMKSTYSADYSFTVGGARDMDPTMDPNNYANHLTPAECMM
jgi:hypothetical protein